MVTCVATIQIGLTIASLSLWYSTDHSGVLNVRALDPFRLRIHEMMHMIRLHYLRINDSRCSHRVESAGSSRATARCKDGIRGSPGTSRGPTISMHTRRTALTALRGWHLPDSLACVWTENSAFEGPCCISHYKKLNVYQKSQMAATEAVTKNPPGS